MNKLWDEAELKWIKTISNSPKSSGHATQLSISFRNKGNILIWCGFVQLPQNLLCRNKTNWTEKVLEEKPHKRTQNASGVAKLLQVLWRRQPRQLGTKASLPVTPASSQMEKCVCVPIHSCVNVSHFRKNLPRSERFCTECVSSQGGEGWSNVCSKQEQLQKQCPSLRLHLPPVCNTLKDNYWICFPHLCGPVSLCYFSQL